MTHIILTRHGHVPWIAPERFRGRAELPLSELGQRQAEALAKRVARSWQPAAIYTSPLSRCVQTGSCVARLTGASAEELATLSDIDYGEWQGLTHEEVQQRWPQEFTKWIDTPEQAIIPSGESLAAVHGRAMQILQWVQQRHPDQTIVLVGHDSINRVILLAVLGLALSHYWRLKQAPCCVNEFSVDGDSSTIYSLNETYHLIDVNM